MGDVIPFPRPPDRPTPEYSEAELEQMRQTFRRMVESGVTDEVAHEAALIRLGMMRGACHGD